MRARRGSRARPPLAATAVAVARAEKLSGHLVADGPAVAAAGDGKNRHAPIIPLRPTRNTLISCSRWPPRLASMTALSVLLVAAMIIGWLALIALGGSGSGGAAQMIDAKARRALAPHAEYRCRRTTTGVNGTRTRALARSDIGTYRSAAVLSSWAPGRRWTEPPLAGTLAVEGADSPTGHLRAQGASCRAARRAVQGATRSPGAMLPTFSDDPQRPRGHPRVERSHQSCGAAPRSTRGAGGCGGFRLYATRATAGSSWHETAWRGRCPGPVLGSGDPGRGFGWENAGG